MPSSVTSEPLVALKDTKLFSPMKIGKLALQHRLVQSPCTRNRAVQISPGISVPGDLLVEYYAQRATRGGLQITEATDICRDASGYPGIPGVFTQAQLAGWKRVTEAVHDKGGLIVCQLWYTGRASSSAMRGGLQPLSSSDIPMEGVYFDGTPCRRDPPRPATVDEIDDLTRTWARAAKNAVQEAGFDGVEIHGANGYLLDQFLHDNVNHRTDAYGGSIQARCRFPLEVIRSVTEAVGPERVGIRLSPYNYFQNTRDSNPNHHWAYFCRQIASLPSSQRPAYVHMIEPRFDEVLDDAEKMKQLASYVGSYDDDQETTKKAVPSLTPFRLILQEAGIAFLAAGGFNRTTCAEKVGHDEADAIVMGRCFIANPDLVERLKEGYALNEYDRSTFYGGDYDLRKGYIDYPFYSQLQA